MKSAYACTTVVMGVVLSSFAGCSDGGERTGSVGLAAKKKVDFNKLEHANGSGTLRTVSANAKVDVKKLDQPFLALREV